MVAGLSLWTRVVVALGLAAALAYAATPVAMSAARHFSFYDRPAGYKGHARPTPYLGGAAVMVAFALALLIGAGHPKRTLPLLAGVVVMSVVGTIDDRRNVSWWVRVLVELGLGAMLAALGVGWHLGAGIVLDAVTTAVWVVAVVNAFNLFDNMDGAASTMALVVAGAVCALAVVEDNVWVAAGSAALCGACLGFLPHNLSSPAKIFLGDGGSMPLGLAIAALVTSAARTAEPSSLALLVGFLLIGIPALDTSLVIFSRRRRGISILTGGQDHLTHRTRQRFRTARRVVMVLGSAQALLSGLVIVAAREGSTTLVYVLLAFVVAAGTTIGVLESASPASSSAGRAEPRASRADGAGHRGAQLALFGVGLGAGISPLFSGYYDTNVWVPIGLGLVVVAAAVVIGRPPKLGRSSTLALIGVAGLGFWSLLSSGWGSSVEQATIEANRWLVYAALLLLLVALVRRRERAFPLLAGAAAGVAFVAASVIARLLESDVTLFLGGRLDAPLGYIDGEGCIFAMGCWFALSLAERREAVLAGTGSAAAVAFAGVTLLSESRGAAIATFAALVLILAAVPGRRRRLMALAVIAAGFAFTVASVSHVYAVQATPAAVQAAGMAVLIASAVTGTVWGLAVAATNAIEARGGRRASFLQRLATAAACVVVAGPCIAAVAKFPALERNLSSQYHAFVKLSGQGTPGATQSRLFSGGGYRYDYWRVAWRVFSSHPLAGVGAGNYPSYYYRARRTNDAIQNPHSLELQTISELGLVGALLLLTVLAAAAVGIRRIAAAARTSGSARSLAVAATGAFTVWLIDTSGDWMHLIPGVAAVALGALAVLCQSDTTFPASAPAVANPSPDSSPWRRGLRLPPRAASILGVALVAFALAVAGASLLRMGVAQFYLSSAQGELRTRPAAAITDAGRALRLDGANLDAYYAKAAGLSRFDQAAAAEETLLQAAREDPSSFVTWTLLGDLEVRLRNFGAAQRFYRQAHLLNPADPSLSALAAHPSSALQG